MYVSACFNGTLQAINGPMVEVDFVVLITSVYETKQTKLIQLRLNIPVNFTGRMLYNTLMLIHIHRGKFISKLSWVPCKTKM